MVAGTPICFLSCEEDLQIQIHQRLALSSHSDAGLAMARFLPLSLLCRQLERGLDKLIRSRGAPTMTFWHCDLCETIWLSELHT
jgi:hypothetical protein